MTSKSRFRDRRSIRLREYDYSRAGAYYVTLCTEDRLCLFGDVVDGVMRLKDAGRMADEFWRQIPEHFPFVKLDKHVVMPNHVHGILWIRHHDGNRVCDVGAQHVAPLRDPNISARDPASSFADKRDRMNRPRVIPGSLGAIIRAYKSTVTRVMRKNGLWAPVISVWQRNYHDHIIRNQRSLDRIRRYIADNPVNWDRDRNNPRRRVRDAHTPGGPNPPPPDPWVYVVSPQFHIFSV